MPIVVKKYTWSQTDDSVSFSVPIKRSYVKGSPDIYADELYLKINAAPYFFEMDMLATVMYDQAVVVVKDEVIEITLPKEEARQWPMPNFECKDRADLMKRRQTSADKRVHRLAEARKKQKELDAIKKRYLVSKQIEIEQNTRERIEDAKRLAKEEAQVDLKKWQAEMAEPAEILEEPGIREMDETEDLSAIEDNRDTQETDEIPTDEPISAQVDDEEECIMEEYDWEEHIEEVTPTPILPVSDDVANKENVVSTITDPEEDDLDEALIESLRQKAKKARAKTIPPLRPTRRIQISFTERNIPGSARESEDAKRNAYWNHTKLVAEKRDKVMSLIEKGQSFYKKKDIPSALNAFTSVIQEDSFNISGLSNRASCYLQLQNYMGAISDCSQALEILDHEKKMEEGEGTTENPYKPDSSKEPQRLRREKRQSKLYAKRAAALVAQNCFEKALQDYRSAYALSPDNEALKADIELIGRKIAGVSQDA